MQQYQVPQFIDIEDRIIGPLTLKQFLYLLASAGVIFLGWVSLFTILFVLLALPLAALFAAMAFAKVNGRPLPTILTSAINYYLRPRLYLWRRTPEKRKPQEKAAPPPTGSPSAGRSSEEALLANIPKLSKNRLSDLAWSLDIQERINR